ncbi:unnamed protein product [Schistosoma turkestanicum]|nr:unnamed protein product [Schistosoma turkestanicum]
MDRRNVSNHLSRNSLSTHSNPHPPLNNTVNKDSFQPVVPLLPVVYPLPIMYNDSKTNSERLHRSSISGGHINSNIRHRSRSRINQFLSLTSRIGLSPVLKRASFQPTNLSSISSTSGHNNYTNNKFKSFNSTSDEESESDPAIMKGDDDDNRHSVDHNHFKVDNNPFTSDTATNISVKTRNLVFASIIFDEFCFELASLCYEHSLNPDIHLIQHNKE